MIPPTSGKHASAAATLEGRPVVEEFVLTPIVSTRGGGLSGGGVGFGGIGSGAGPGGVGDGSSGSAMMYLDKMARDTVK
jgi:hypothetical protein